MDWGTVIILTMVGLVLIAVDFYIPGFVLGSIGILMMLGATALCYNVKGLVPASLLFAVEVVLGGGAAYISIVYVPKTAMGKKMFLHHTQTGQRAQATVASDLPGKQGVAQTVLRPAGMAIIDGKRVDVLAESGMIEAGTPIEVVAVKENQIIVRKQ
jgi:membrane-bound serine protease (ClpP class)